MCLAVPGKLNLLWISGGVDAPLAVNTCSSDAAHVSVPAWPWHSWSSWAYSLRGGAVVHKPSPAGAFGCHEPTRCSCSVQRHLLDSLHLWCTAALGQRNKSPIFPLKAEFTVRFQNNRIKMCKAVCPRLNCGMWSLCTPVWEPAGQTPRDKHHLFPGPSDERSDTYN